MDVDFFDLDASPFSNSFFKSSASVRTKRTESPYVLFATINAKMKATIEACVQDSDKKIHPSNAFVSL